MFILILCYIFSDTLNLGATVIDIIQWFNYHPFLAIFCIEEIICSLISIKIIKN